MIHLTMNVDIEVLADDEWGSSRAWVENEVMHKIENAMIDLFEYPISVNAELQDWNIYDGMEDKTE